MLYRKISLIMFILLLFASCSQDNGDDNKSDEKRKELVKQVDDLNKKINSLTVNADCPSKNLCSKSYLTTYFNQFKSGEVMNKNIEFTSSVLDALKPYSTAFSYNVTELSDSSLRVIFGSEYIDVQVSWQHTRDYADASLTLKAGSTSMTATDFTEFQTKLKKDIDDEFAKLELVKFDKLIYSDIYKDDNTISNGYTFNLLKKNFDTLQSFMVANNEIDNEKLSGGNYNIRGKYRNEMVRFLMY